MDDGQRASMIYRTPAIVILASLLHGCLAYRALAPAPVPDGALIHQDVAYAPPGADPDRNKLDVYLPEGSGPHPVVVFVHGGYWQAGGRREAFGVYERLGRRLAAKGIAAVVISYRLSPRYRFPVQIEDVAAAVASTLRNLDKINGDKKQVYLVGHSAGGHLVMLTALESRWLARHGVSRSAIAGVVSISGVYDIEDLSRDMFGAPNVRRVFGRNEALWKLASPVNLAKSDTPRLLLAIGDRDDATLRRQHKAMVAALKKVGAPAEEVEIDRRTHSLIVIELFSEGDPLGEEIEKFMQPARRATRDPSAAR
jgi:acetyl esterase/lipase